jgi:hypothetical protein
LQVTADEHVSLIEFDLKNYNGSDAWGVKFISEETSSTFPTARFDTDFSSRLLHQLSAPEFG